MMQNKKLNKTSSNAKFVNTPEVKAEVKEAVQGVTKKTVDTAEKTKDVAEKAVKEVAEKTKGVAEKTAKTVETKAKAVKKTAKKVAKEVMVPQILVQYQNLEVDIAMVEERVKAQFVAEGHRAGTIKKLNIYVKPEEYAAYYVINDKFTGRVDLF